MKRIKPAVTLVVGSCFMLLNIFSLSWGRLPDPEMDLDEIRRNWKSYEQIKNTAKIRGSYPYMKCFEKTARKYNLSLPLLLAVARGESNFNRRAKSVRDCYGIMQIQWPETANDLGIFKKRDLFDPCKNIDCGGKYLSALLKQFNGDTFFALASYNYGPNRIRREIRKNNVPEGVLEYAAYIYEHLEYILSRVYENTGRLLVFEYTHYKTAAQYRDLFEEMVQGVPFEIFKANKYTYNIYITYNSLNEQEKFANRFMEKTGIKPLGLKH